MAEFSKQYCDIWDHGFPYDFDIEKIAKDLTKGNYYPIICEGFGFHAIAKDRNDQILLGFLSDPENVWSSSSVVWQDYNNFMASQYKCLEEELKKEREDRIF
jgi:hypothetical protein